MEKPEGEQLFEYKVDPDKVEEIKEKLEEIKEKLEEIKEKLEEYIKVIQNKEFHATPGFKICQWCEYSDICDAKKIEE